MGHKVVVIPGDGAGPEITEATLHVLKSLDLDIEFIIQEAGYAFWKKTGKQLTQETIELIKECGVCLKGPTATPYGPGTYKSVAVTLRQELELYANVRPIKSFEGINAPFQNVDFVIIRENTEGLYKGYEYRIEPSVAIGIRVITRKGSERILRFAFEYARKNRKNKVTVVHKANVLKETCGLFREVAFEVAKAYEDIKLEELLVDAAALKIVRHPEDLQVLVTTNLFGDILSDEAAGIVGGLGLVPSANIGDKYAMFEPAHGTVEKYAGKGIVNPSAMILASAMMLHRLNEHKAANILERALREVLAEGKKVTPDIGGNASTMEMAHAISEKVRAYSDSWQKNVE